MAEVDWLEIQLISWKIRDEHLPDTRVFEYQRFAFKDDHEMYPLIASDFAATDLVI